MDNIKVLNGVGIAAAAVSAICGIVGMIANAKKTDITMAKMVAEEVAKQMKK